MSTTIFCSTIIPTIGRSTLKRAVESVLDQEFDRAGFEIVVVNDTGQHMPHKSWLASKRVRIISTNKRKQVIAQNVGAAMAKGQYLNFLGDDDWLLPGALQHFWKLAQSAPDADWLLGHTQLVDRQDHTIVRLRHNLEGNLFIHTMAGEWLPVTSSFIKSEAFFDIGGYNQHCLTAEDVDLARRICLSGRVALTPQIISAVRMGEEGSSTPRHMREQSSRKEREKILGQPGVLKRMFASANSSYLHGRIVRVWLTSMIWNLQMKHVTNFVSRAIFAIVSIFLTLPYFIFGSYWYAILFPYKNETFIRSFDERLPLKKPVT